MIKLIEKKCETKKYTDAVCSAFNLYRINGGDETSNSCVKDVERVIKLVEENKLYCGEPAKKNIFLFHFLENSSIEEVARKTNFSRSYLYSVKKEMLKELAMMMFGVLII